MTRGAPCLHALANTPGAGKAFDALKKAGFIGEDPSQPLWRVVLYGTQPIAAVIEVRAATAEEAEKLSMEKAHSATGRPDLLHWEVIGDPQVEFPEDVDLVEDGQ